jgi:hypothetical protein
MISSGRIEEHGQAALFDEIRRLSKPISIDYRRNSISE